MVCIHIIKIKTIFIWHNARLQSHLIHSALHCPIHSDVSRFVACSSCQAFAIIPLRSFIELASFFLALMLDEIIPLHGMRSVDLNAAYIHFGDIRQSSCCKCPCKPSRTQIGIWCLEQSVNVPEDVMTSATMYSQCMLTHPPSFWILTPQFGHGLLTVAIVASDCLSSARRCLASSAGT